MEKPFPILHTSRLTITQIEETHIADFYRLMNDKEISRFTHMGVFDTESEVRHYVNWLYNRFQQGNGIYWGITLKGSTKLIGTIGYNFFTPGERGNLGYDLDKTYRRQGYMREALYAVVTFGFQVFEINRVEAEVIQGNMASKRLLEKIGFHKEGLLRAWRYKDNKPYNVWMYSLLRSEVKITNPFTTVSILPICSHPG